MTGWQSRRAAESDGGVPGRGSSPPEGGPLGLRVSAVVRDPARLAVRHPELTVVRANALDPGEVAGVVEGADTVLSGIGRAGRHDPLRPASASARTSGVRGAGPVG
ncbi:NAD(P)H-binding protein [Kitasatospora sp. NPDC058444]|uniref:NAD(P)H-binding protein n=1 Tax=Kitasatospora sp. NPDC058444 TaxID=3346504 RepID=UPI0036601181